MCINVSLSLSIMMNVHTTLTIFQNASCHVSCDRPVGAEAKTWFPDRIAGKHCIWIGVGWENPMDFRFRTSQWGTPPFRKQRRKIGHATSNSHRHIAEIHEEKTNKNQHGLSLYNRLYNRLYKPLMVNTCKHPKEISQHRMIKKQPGCSWASHRTMRWGLVFEGSHESDVCDVAQPRLPVVAASELGHCASMQFWHSLACD